MSADPSTSGRLLARPDAHALTIRLAKAPLEALLETLAEALGLGVDVEDLRVELEPLDRACSIPSGNGARAPRRCAPSVSRPGDRFVHLGSISATFDVSRSSIGMKRS
jgi:hypothetical protein